MRSYFWRTGVENFIKPRVKQEIGNLMSSFSNAYIFRRKDCAEHFFEHGCAGRCFGTGLNHSRVSSCKAGGENTQREENRKVVRADQQCCAIWHFINLREETRETGQATEMGFRPGPSLQIPDSFIDLNKSRTDIAEIGFRITPSEICYQRSFQLWLIRDQGFFQSFELFDAPVDIQSNIAAKETFLLFQQDIYMFLIPTNRSCSHTMSAPL